MFKQITVIFGVLAIAKSRVEWAGETYERLVAALAHIDAERLFAVSYFGLGLLGRELAIAKPQN